MYDDCAVLQLLSSCRSATTLLQLTNLHVRYSFDRCCTTSGTNNIALVRMSGTRDKFYKSGTVPEIPGQLEPMELV